MGGVLILLGACHRYRHSCLNGRATPASIPAVIEQFNLRIRAWWLLCAVLAAAFLLGRIATVMLFGSLSFWALREFITLTPTRLADHRALFWVFFASRRCSMFWSGMDEYCLYSILIPVYAFLFIPARDRDGRRLQTLPGTLREDSSRADDLRLLPQLCRLFYICR